LACRAALRHSERVALVLKAGPSGQAVHRLVGLLLHHNDPTDA
jgi:hypothetical protein